MLSQGVNKDEIQDCHGYFLGRSVIARGAWTQQKSISISIGRAVAVDKKRT